MAASSDTRESYFISHLLGILDDANRSYVPKLLHRLLEDGKTLLEADGNHLNDLQHILLSLEAMLKELLCTPQNQIGKVSPKSKGIPFLAQSADVRTAAQVSDARNARQVSVDLLTGIVNTLCIPFLWKCTCSQSRRDYLLLLPASKLARRCIVFACALEVNGKLTRDAINLCTSSVKKSAHGDDYQQVNQNYVINIDTGGTLSLPLFMAIDLLSALLNDTRTAVHVNTSYLFKNLLPYVTKMAETAAIKVLINVFPKILNEIENINLNIQLIWNEVKKMGKHDAQDGNNVVAMQCLILCALAKLYISSEINFSKEVKQADSYEHRCDTQLAAEADTQVNANKHMVGEAYEGSGDNQPLGPTNIILMQDNKFWRILQDGITHEDPLTRKRSLFLLQWSVNHNISSDRPCSSNLFHWSTENCKLYSHLWESFILFLETLEEKQVMLGSCLYLCVCVHAAQI